MSGFEVVGVVLGAIPLIISAVDYYRATSQRIKFMIEKNLLLNQLIESLKEQKFFLQTDICLALKETHLDGQQIIALIDERGLDLFQDPEVADALKEYLGEGFTMYTNAVARCEHTLSDIIANIGGLVSTTQVPMSTPSIRYKTQHSRHSRTGITSQQSSRRSRRKMANSNLPSESSSASEKKIYSGKSMI